MPANSSQDFLTNVQDAFIDLMKEVPIIKEYHWERWDSDSQAKQPRAYVTIEAEGELTYGDVSMVTLTVVLEGKPRRQKLATAMQKIHQVIKAANLGDLLAERSNDTLTFFGRGERYSIRQTIEGTLRQRRIQFSIGAGPLN